MSQETVEQICKRMKEPSIHKGRFPASFFDGEFCDFADKILAAHNSEILVERNMANDHITGLQDKIASLKSLVKELADAIDNITCHANCETSQNDVCDDDCYHVKNRELVAKAREACK